jgi:hypothetical protein
MVRVYLPLNPDVKCLVSARTSDIPMLDWTMTVGHEGNDLFYCIMEAIATNAQTSNERKRQKRLADESIVLSDNNDGNFPLFTVVEAADGQPIKYSIFAIQKLLKCAFGDVKCAKKLQNSTMLIKATSKAQADKALQMTNWIDVQVKVSPHRSLNTSKGIIRCSATAAMTRYSML